jgi:hypothetical protein
MKNDDLKQFSADLATTLKTAVEGHADFIAKVKASGDDRTFEVVMSTSDEDRQGDALDQSGWDLKYFDMNPVLLWAHNYQGFPIGIITDIEIRGNEAVATGKFAPAGVNPEADLACALYQEKILRAVSPGYIQNDDGTRELLEVSFCPVPAGRYALSLRQVRSIGFSTRELVTKGFFYTTKGAVPYADHGNAVPDTAWDGPAEVKACGDDLDKLKAICAWFNSENADKKSAYKLPHHEANGLKAVWKGVSAAGAAISGARGGVDIPEGDLAAVKAHLAKHYKAFGKTPPWEKKAADDPVLGDPCELDDGTPGVLAKDPKNPDRLICVPPEGKSKSNETQENMNDELTKKLKAEHERHGKAVEKHIDEFEEKAVPHADEKAEDGKEGSDNSEMEKAIDEFETKMDAEQETHREKCDKAIDDAAEKIDPEEKKSIDEFRKAMEGEHLKHVKAFHKAIDEFKSETDGDPEKCEKAIDEFRTKADDELERHEKAHKELCEAEFGEGEDDEKKAVTKSGRAISAANAEKIKAVIKAVEDYHQQHTEDHQKHTDNVIAALKELMAPKQGDDGEEDEDDESRARKSRSSSAGAATNKDGTMSELDTYLFAQRLLRQVKSASEDGLRQVKEDLKKKFPSRR